MTKSNPVAGVAATGKWVASPHTLLLDLPAPIAGRTRAAVNLLSGAFHLVDEQEAKVLHGDTSAGTVTQACLDHHYYFGSSQEARAYLQQKQQAFDDVYSQTPVQLLLAPTYACELACPYCYQRSYPQQGLMNERQVDLALDAPAGQGREKFVTLFGGEPLGQGAALKQIVRKIMNASRERKLPVAVVTNGYRLREWMDDLSRGPIKEVQVTLDGGPLQHDRRRMTKTKEPTFAKIVAGIDLTLQAGLPVNLRVVLDKHNMEGLLELARLAQDHGWLDQPEGKFKTQLGRNYELYDAYSCPRDLLTQDGLYRQFVTMAKVHPLLRRFHQPSFYGLKEWIKQEEMLTPRFDACPAAKHEWGFDMSGRIYGCTATLGQPAYALGTYDPVWRLNEAAKAWQGRRVQRIAGCSTCSVAPACGGGCGILAQVKSNTLYAPDCKPIAAVMQAGLDFYFEELTKKIEEAFRHGEGN